MSDQTDPQNAGDDTTPQPPATAEERVRVAVVNPFYVDSFVAFDTLTVDRLGVKVPRDDVPDLVLKASKSGVTLKVN